MIARAMLLATALAACASSPKPAATAATSCPSTNSANATRTADAKALVLRLQAELWDKRDPDAALNGALASDLVNHAAIASAQGAEGVRSIAKKLFAAFPDMSMTVLDAVADGDRVVLRVAVEGTHTGDLAFAHPLPATGKHFKLEQVFTFRVANGKIVEEWMTMDRLDLMQQLGVMPH